MSAGTEKIEEGEILSPSPFLLWSGVYSVWYRLFQGYLKTWLVNCLPSLSEPLIYLGAFGLGLSTLVFFINVFYSLRYGPKAPNNPWRSTTLEWTLPSPVTLHGNFPVTPTVYNGPYEYSVPGMEEDYLPQNVKAPETARIEIH